MNVPVSPSYSWGITGWAVIGFGRGSWNEIPIYGWIAGGDAIGSGNDFLSSFLGDPGNPGDPQGSSGADRPWWQKMGFKDDPRNLRLVALTDCIGAGREINYSLLTTSENQPNGTYVVTEHQTNPSVTDSPYTTAQRPGGSGTSTSEDPNHFPDRLAGLASGSSSLQYFTISTDNPATTPGYPVVVRNNQGDFSVLGLFNAGGRVLVNGTWPDKPCN